MYIHPGSFKENRFHYDSRHELHATFPRMTKCSHRKYKQIESNLLINLIYYNCARNKTMLHKLFSYQLKVRRGEEIKFIDRKSFRNFSTIDVYDRC